MSNANDALTFGMSQITSLIEQGFTLFNVSEKKLPVNSCGIAMDGWETITAAEVKQHHNRKSSLWGLRMGLHENGRRLMSLDFDCCGPSKNGERQGCEYTKAKLHEYQALGVLDGMYASSTKGNMNVLVDYTACPTLIDRIGKDSKLKRKGTDLEILCGSKHQQVIPPAMTKCKISGRAENRRAYLSTTPLLLLKEDMDVFPFILSLIDEAKEEEKPKPKATTSVSSQEENVPEEPPTKATKSRNLSLEEKGQLIESLVSAILECNSQFFDHYDEWVRLGFIIANEMNRSIEGCELFFRLSANFHSKSGKKQDKNEVTNQYYKATKKEKHMTCGTLYYWLKEENPNHELLKQQKYKIATTDEEAADILFDELKHVLKSWKGRLFYLHNHVWTYDTNVNELILRYVMQSNIYRGINEKTNKPIPFTQNLTNAKKVMDTLCNKMRVENVDNELYEKFHQTTKGKLCFEDGVLDFAKKSFTRWEDLQDEVYTTTKINRNYGDYFQSPNRELVNKIKSDIFEPAYGDKKDTALWFLSRAMAGHLEDKRFATYLANRNSGKGVEFDLLKGAFGAYVSAFDLSNVLCARNSSSIESVEAAKQLYWLLDLEFVRLAISQETPDPSTGLKLNAKRWKKLTGGGDEHIARRNYDRADTHFLIDTTFYIKGNHTLECSANDCNEERLEFNSVTQFKPQAEIDYMKTQVENKERSAKEMERYRVANPSIKSDCKTIAYQNACVYLLLESYKAEKVPIFTTGDMDVALNEILVDIDEHYELTGNAEDILLASGVYDKLKAHDKGKVTNELSAMNVHKKKHTKDAFRNKWCFYGIKEKATPLPTSNTNGTTP